MTLAGTYIAYKTIQFMVKDFKDWEAFKLGIIDEKGNVIKSPETKEEKSNFDTFHVMVKNLKRLLAKLPMGTTKLASFASALWLIKENLTDKSIQFDIIMMEHFQISPADVLLTEEKKGDKLDVGIYEDDFNNIYTVRQESQSPVSHYLGVNIYKVTDSKTKKDCFVCKQQIKKYKKI